MGSFFVFKNYFKYPKIKTMLWSHFNGKDPFSKNNFFDIPSNKCIGQRLSKIIFRKFLFFYLLNKIKFATVSVVERCTFIRKKNVYLTYLI